MTAEIVKLTRNKNRDLVEYLKELLDKAERDEIDYILVYEVDKNSTHSWACFGTDSMTALAATVRLQHDINADWDSYLEGIGYEPDGGL